MTVDELLQKAEDALSQARFNTPDRHSYSAVANAYSYLASVKLAKQTLDLANKAMEQELNPPKRIQDLQRPGRLAD